MTYEKLYSNMVKKFTVEKDNKDYKLGEYMLMKADSVKAEKKASSSLPVALSDFSGTKAISAAFNYISEKITVKEAPIRDKTMRKFPFRTSLTALCSAIVVCAIIVTYGIIGYKNMNADVSVPTVVYGEVDEFVEEQTDTAYSLPAEK